jgi:hypothetical protein
VLSLSPPELQTFLADTVSRGYNAIELHVINHDPRGNHPPFNGNGDLPFVKQLDGRAWSGALLYDHGSALTRAVVHTRLGSHAPDFSTPNEAYWAYLDAFLAACESQGILVLLFPAYVGYEGGDQGWMREIVANGPTRMQFYGSWLANRYKDQKNLVWMMGGDFGSFDLAQEEAQRALLLGLMSVASQESTLLSAEWSSETIATDQPSFGGQMTLNGVYSWSGDVNTHGRRAYNRVPTIPAFLLEEPYDQEGPDGNSVNASATQPVRRFQWWGWLSTIGGYVSGNGYVWPFRPGWQNHLDSAGTSNMQRLNAFIASVPWFELVPSGLNGMPELITAGGGQVSDEDYVAAAASPDGTLLVAYVPPAHAGGALTVNVTVMGDGIRGRWFDPTNATYQHVPDSPFANTAPRSFTPPGLNGAGENDWVLVLDRAG